MCVAPGFQKSIFKTDITYTFPPPVLAYHHTGSVCELDQVYEEKTHITFISFSFATMSWSKLGF